MGTTVDWKILLLKDYTKIHVTCTNVSLFTPASFAVALAIIVFPQPGGPCNKTPTLYKNKNHSHVPCTLIEGVHGKKPQVTSE